MDTRIYLDNNATTGIDPQVLEAMLFDLCQMPRNPSSVHSFGQEARNELTKARRIVADILNVLPEELVFTSGGTESNNTLLQGFFKKIFPKEIITTKIEHNCVYKNILKYQESGGKVTFLDPGVHGTVKPEDLEKAITPETGLIVLMAVNNETGVKLDIEAVGEIAYRNKIPFISDGVALLGKEPFKVPQGVSAMSFSGHKLHGPKGIGLTYLSQDYEIEPLIIGGKQENESRAGTHNLSGILGFSKAIELLESLLPKMTSHMQKMRDLFEKSLIEKLDFVKVNGEGERICNTSNLAFTGLDGESLMITLDMQGIACSHGSACQTGSLTPSRILSEMGYKKDRLNSSLRFAVSRNTTQQEILRAVDIITQVATQMKG